MIHGIVHMPVFWVAVVLWALVGALYVRGGGIR